MTEPDLSKLTKDQRRAIVRYLRGGWFNTFAITVGMFAYGIVATIASLLLAAILSRFLEQELGMAQVPSFIIIFLATLWLLIWMVRRVDRQIETQMLHKLLRAKHENGRLSICPYCGYNLHGTTSPTCPECGEDVIEVVSINQRTMNTPQATNRTRHD